MSRKQYRDDPVDKALDAVVYASRKAARATAARKPRNTETVRTRNEQRRDEGEQRIARTRAERERDEKIEAFRVAMGWKPEKARAKDWKYKIGTSAE